MSRVRGRPKGSNKPQVKWEEVDALLVHGATSISEEGEVLTRYPSYRELGEKFKVAHTLVAKFAEKNNCLERREQAAKRFREVKDQKLAEFRGDQVAVKIDDKIRIIDRCLIKFEEMVKEGQIQLSPADFNTFCRLKLLLQGDVESRQEVMGGLSIDELQRRHREYLEDFSEVTPEMTGMVIEQEEEKPDAPKGDQPLPPKTTVQ
jgi:hypothetical protein